MKRSSFIAALLGCIGIGKAQSALGMHHARNGQCPVCGTLAPLLKRPIHQVQWTIPEKPGWMGSRNEPYGEIEHIVRCKRCSAAFWQDAE